MRGLRVGVLLGTVGCTSAAESEKHDLAARVSTHTIQQVVDGVTVDRTYSVHLPPNRDLSIPLPLLFAFHGGGGEGHFFTEDLDEYIQGGTFIGVYPEGIQGTWNLGREASTADDVAFVLSILDDLEGSPGFDIQDPVSMGFSNGAGFVHKLAVEADRFVSIGAMASQLLVDKEPQAGDAHVSVLQLHGTDDPIISYDGGTAQMDHSFLSAEDSAAEWAAHNGCSTTATEAASGAYTRMEWEQCSTGTRVVHYRLDGVGHDIPGNVEGDTMAMIVDFLVGTRP